MEAIEYVRYIGEKSVQAFKQDRIFVGGKGSKLVSFHVCRQKLRLIYIVSFRSPLWASLLGSKSCRKREKASLKASVFIRLSRLYKKLLYLPFEGLFQMERNTKPARTELVVLLTRGPPSGKPKVGKINEVGKGELTSVRCQIYS